MRQARDDDELRRREVAYIIILNILKIILYTIHNNVLGLGVLPICNDVVHGNKQLRNILCSLNERHTQ